MDNRAYGDPDTGWPSSGPMNKREILGWILILFGPLIVGAVCLIID